MERNLSNSAQEYHDNKGNLIDTQSPVALALESVNTTCLVPQHRRNAPDIPGVRPVLSGKSSATRSMNFRALFCDKFQCSPQEYEQQMFSRCLHRHTFPVTRFLSKMNPDFFREDTGLIQDLATAGSHGEVLTELNRFYGRNVRDRNWLRKRFSLRISGKRVLRLSRKLFRSQRSP
jgi:hypothetical protein